MLETPDEKVPVATEEGTDTKDQLLGCGGEVVPGGLSS